MTGLAVTVEDYVDTGACVEKADDMQVGQSWDRPLQKSATASQLHKNYNMLPKNPTNSFCDCHPNMDVYLCGTVSGHYLRGYTSIRAFLVCLQ